MSSSNPKHPTDVMRARMLGQSCMDCKFRRTERAARYSANFGNLYKAYCQKRDNEPKDNFCVQFKPQAPN